MLKKTALCITILCLGLCCYQLAFAEVMIPAGPSNQTKLQAQEATLGGTIAKFENNLIEINAVKYTLGNNGVRIHGFSGKLIKPSDLKVGMLVNFKALHEGNLVKISEIWVIKDE